MTIWLAAFPLYSGLSRRINMCSSSTSLSYYSIVFFPSFPSIILSLSPNPLNQPESSKDVKRGALADQLMTFKKGQRNRDFSLARDELAASAHQG